MKLSISNIAWNAADDAKIYHLMKNYGFDGLEIAPTRILPEMPYDRLEDIKKWYEDLWDAYGFHISSMQSIWYGRKENLFGTDKERELLMAYTKKAIKFARAVECKNLVFGCPRNRYLPEGEEPEKGVRFFKEIGDYASKNSTALAMEANPSIYNTNYINDTPSALELVKTVCSPGFLLNLDVGTMLYNKEQISLPEGTVKFINHVHISERRLNCIQQRNIHRELFSLLKNEHYDGYISIEMEKQDDFAVIESTMGYIRELWDDL